MNAYEVKAGIGVIAVNTVLSMPDRLECEVVQKVRYINTLRPTYLPTCITRTVDRRHHMQTHTHTHTYLFTNK